MTERAVIPPPPVRSGALARDGTFSLQWLAWLSGVTLWIQRVRVYSFAVDVPLIGAGASWVADYAIGSVQPGDFAQAALDPSDGGLVVTAQVTAINTVRVRAQNLTGAGIDLAAGTIFIRVEKAR